MEQEVTNTLRNLTLAHLQNVQAELGNLNAQKQQLDQRIADLQTQLEVGTKAIETYDKESK